MILLSPDYYASLCVADAHGTRDPFANSITQVLYRGRFDISDQIKTPGGGVNRLNDRGVQFYPRQFLDQFMHTAWFCLNQNISVNHISLCNSVMNGSCVALHESQILITLR